MKVELCEPGAHLLRGGRIHLPDKFRSVCGTEDLFPVEHEIDILQAEQQVAQRLQGDIAFTFRSDQVNVVIRQGNLRDFPELVEALARRGEHFRLAVVFLLLNGGHDLFIGILPACLHFHSQFQERRDVVFFRLRKVDHRDQGGHAGVVQEIAS